MNGGPSSGPAIAFRQVTKDYAVDWRGRLRRALDEVSFEVEPGSICALVGPNGSGKTTLLKIAAGVAAATAGTCWVAGRCGFAPDALDLPGYLTPREALVRIGLVTGASRDEAARAAEAALERAGLAAEADRRMAGFSKGLRQRVAVAQAWLGEPEVLLLDEPAAALDPCAAEALAEALQGERAAGRTVLFSSHFLPQVEEVADRFVVLEAGRVLWAGGRGEALAGGGLRARYREAVRR